MMIWQEDSLVAQEDEFFLNRPTAQKYVVILGGAAAEEKYAERFRKWTLTLYEILVVDYGYSPDQIILLLGNGDPKESRISGSSRQADIQKHVLRLQKKVRAGDQVVFVLIGHGTYDGDTAKFNIVGPDITGNDFAEILAKFPDQDLIVIDTRSTSYPFCLALSAPGRVVISATRSHLEKYDTVFPQFFIEALAEHKGDRDKNQRISLWEVFQYVQNKVVQWYEEQERLLTEHVVLDDNGDRVFSTNPSPSENDGKLAHIAYLDQSLPSDIGKGKNAVKKRQLFTKKENLERSITLLKIRKTQLSPENYYQQLEPLLIELARTSRQLRSLY